MPDAWLILDRRTLKNRLKFECTFPRTESTYIYLSGSDECSRCDDGRLHLNFWPVSSRAVPLHLHVKDHEDHIDRSCDSTDDREVN